MSTGPGTNSAEAPCCATVTPKFKEIPVYKLAFFLVPFLIASCGGLDDLISDLEDYEYEEGYECYPGDAMLPAGSHPEHLVTPEGYVWECRGGGADSIHFNFDGTFSATLSRVAYSEARDYFDDCSGFADREETGEWVVSRGLLCLANDNVQPGLYNCQRFTHGSGTVRGSGCVDYYEDGDYLGNECDADGKLGTCTLVEE